jgi:ribosomal protein S18 acetylase RimI-like enzyme
VDGAVRIRKASPADQPFILATAERLADFELPPGRQAGDVIAAEHRALREAFERFDEAALYIAETEDGRPLGFLYLERQTDYFTQRPHGHVSMVALAKEAEGRGAGKALMQAAEDWARANSLPYLTLNVFSSNARARVLYERLGYAPDTVIKYLKVL